MANHERTTAAAIKPKPTKATNEVEMVPLRANTAPSTEQQQPISTEPTETRMVPKRANKASAAKEHLTKEQIAAAMEEALKNRNTEAVEALLPHINPNTQRLGKKKLLPLHYLVKTTDSGATETKKTMKVLIEAKADVNQVDEHSRTPARCAIQNKSLATLATLLALKANPDYPDGREPLWHEALIWTGEDWSTYFRLLLHANASINRSDAHGYTPLIDATKYHNLSLCKFLLRKKASVNDADIAGMTPKDFLIQSIDNPSQMKGATHRILVSLAEAKAVVDAPSEGDRKYKSIF